MKEWETYNRAHELLAKAGLDDDNTRQLEALGYFCAPASKSHHLAVAGGLTRHSINVTERLVDLTNKLGVVWPRPESPYLVGMLHDLCKTETYIIDEESPCPPPAELPEGKVAPDAPKYKYVPTIYGGHGAASAMLIMSNLRIHLHPAEAAAIRWHMGAFGLSGDELREYDRALDTFPLELIATHTADMLAARMDEGRS